MTRRCPTLVLCLFAAACDVAPATTPSQPAPRPSTSATNRWSAPATPAPGTIAVELARGDGTAADAQLSLGDKLYAAADFVRAAEAFDAAHALAPRDAAPLVGWARAAMAAADVPTGVNEAPGNEVAEAAALRLHRATKLDATNAAAHLELGRVLLVLGQIPRAIEPLEVAARLAPREAEAHGALGIARLLTGDRPGAVAALSNAVNMDPKNPARLVNLGTAQMQAGQVSSAIVSYDKAVRLRPDNALYLSNLGTAFLQQGDFKSALPHLQRAVELAPNKATYRSNLGYALQLSGARDRALSALTKAVELDPTLASAWINLGNVLAQKQRFDEARAAYAKANDLDPEDPRVRAAIDDLEELTGQSQ